MSVASKTRSRRGPRLELRALEVFVAVAEIGNMTLAARKLMMTQPAVSQIVKHLEDEIGAPLLDRELRPLRVTPPGAALFTRAKQLLQDADGLLRDVRMESERVLPRFRIGFVDSFATTAGPQLVKSLRPCVKDLLVWSGIAPELREELIRRDLDVVISPDPLDGVAGIDSKRILTEGFLVLLPAGFKPPGGELSLAKLAQKLPLVRFSSRSQIGHQIDRHLLWQRIDAPKSLEFDSAESIISMVAQGIGWTILTPLTLMQAPSALPLVTPVHLPGPALSRTLYVVHRSREFRDIPERIIAQCGLIFSGEIAPKLNAIAPWLLELFRPQHLG